MPKTQIPIELTAGTIVPIRFEPGDRLLVTLAKRLPDANVKAVMEHLKRWAGDVPVLVTCRDEIAVEVVKFDSPAAVAAAPLHGLVERPTITGARSIPVG